MAFLQGFRKYLTQAKDHEELLAFLLGHIVKEKVYLYQLQKRDQPTSITVKVTELDERVSRRSLELRTSVNNPYRQKSMIFSILHHSYVLSSSLRTDTRLQMV